MDGQRFFLILLSGFPFCPWISGSVVEKVVRSGDNITLYCDCPLTTGVYTVWYRNCCHLNQPTLVLKTKLESDQSHYRFVKNNTSKSYDLIITNITESDEGFYFCGTETTKVEDQKYIEQKSVFTYGNATTRILLNSPEPKNPNPDGACWTLLFSLCPAIALLSSLLSVFLAYLLCHKKDTSRAEARVETRQNEAEDVCYAALEIRQASQRPKKKTTAHTSDFSTYSAVRTSR